jgi:osmotically-inducible protein OsmY
MSAIIDRSKRSLPASETIPQIEEKDAEIVEKAIRALRSNLCIPAERIMVIVLNRLIILEGSVEFQVQRLLAEAAVKRLGDITGIRNRIEVRPEDFACAPGIQIEEEAPD